MSRVPQVTSLAHLHFQRPVGFGGSNHLLLDGFVKLRTGKDILGSFNFVDVRCAAECHVEALIRPSAGGNRILLPGHHVSWQEICKLLESGGKYLLKPNQIQPTIIMSYRSVPSKSINLS